MSNLLVVFMLAVIRRLCHLLDKETSIWAVSQLRFHNCSPRTIFSDASSLGVTEVTRDLMRCELGQVHFPRFVGPLVQSRMSIQLCNIALDTPAQSRISTAKLRSCLLFSLESQENFC